MLKAYKNGAILCCGTKSDANVEKAGLVLGHAYTIVMIILFSLTSMSSQRGYSKFETLGEKENGKEEGLSLIVISGRKFQLQKSKT